MFEIDIKHKIGLDGFIEQDLPYQCPECNTELTVKETIGFGEYPKGGWRARMKPNQTIGQGFECPKCFTKSCFHADKYSYQLYCDVTYVEATQEMERRIKANNNFVLADVSNRRELLCAFFKFFRDNGEANIGMSIEQFVDVFLSTQ